MSSSKEEGWLETKIGRAEHWDRMWVVFDDGVLYYSPSQPHYTGLVDRESQSSAGTVPMDQVISLRTDVRLDHIILSLVIHFIMQ
jgi:hypothetical protein